MGAKKAGMPALFAQRTGSISRKYSQGYFFILASAALVFIFSFINSQIVTADYQKEMDDLLMLNEIYIGVGNVRSMIVNSITLVGSETASNMRLDIAKCRQTLEQVYARLDEEYSRDVMDLCSMVEAYLEQAEEIIGHVGEKIGGDGADLFDALIQPDFVALRRGAMDTYGYIEGSFRDIYSAKLLHARQVRESLSAFRLTMSIIQMSIVLAALGGCLLFYKRVVEGISKSVARLTLFTKDIKEDPGTKRRVSIKTGDEIELFAVSFNEMLDQIQRQIAMLEEDAQIKERLAAAEMENLRVVGALQSNELKFLQSRINPHFLFNTLNMVVQTAKLEGADGTARLLETTAELLRYSMSKLSMPVSMADELANINNYLLIQQSRFGDRLSYRCEADSQCLDQQVPCMILQPLIENSVTHGIGPKVDGGTVRLRVFGKGRRCCFEVEDDGVGIPKGKLEQLMGMHFGEDDSEASASGTSSASSEAGASSIGIKNVYQRLMIFYRQDVVFEIASRPGKTLIHVELPRP